MKLQPSNIFTAIQREYPIVSDLIHRNLLQDKDENLYKKLMEIYKGYTRYNKEIFSETSKYVAINPNKKPFTELIYLQKDDGQVKDFTNLLCLDLNTKNGIITLLESIKHLVIICIIL